jgi:hypothetical protein
MLYTIFLYQSHSGVLVYKQSFENNIGSKSELFASFFSAIQSFVTQMIMSDSTGKGLESIDLGKYLINITKIPSLGIDCVLIADREDQKEIKKFLPKLMKLFTGHQELFENWDGEVSRLDVLDVEVIQVLTKFKKLSGQDSDVDGKTQLMDEILGRLPELEKDQINHYIKEKKFLEKRFQETTSLYRKLEIIESMEEVCRKLRDTDEMERILKIRKKTHQELVALKEKLAYYLRQAKFSISNSVEQSGHKPLYDIDFRDSYVNLYSFSTKLKFVGRDDLSEKYKAWAMILIEKPPEKESEFSTIINSILKLPDDINLYITADQK